MDFNWDCQKKGSYRHVKRNLLRSLEFDDNLFFNYFLTSCRALQIQGGARDDYRTQGKVMFSEASVNLFTRWVMQTPQDADPPPRVRPPPGVRPHGTDLTSSVGTAAVGTHAIGMHSCFHAVFGQTFCQIIGITGGVHLWCWCPNLVNPGSVTAYLNIGSKIFHFLKKLKPMVTVGHPSAHVISTANSICQEGTPTRKGTPIYYFAKFFQKKLHENEETWTKGRGRLQILLCRPASGYRKKYQNSLAHISHAWDQAELIQ